jgi:hypothetical protein
LGLGYEGLLPAMAATNLLLWLSGSEAVLGLGDLRFVFEHLRALCETPGRSRSLGMLPALRLLAVASLSLSLSQTYVRWASDG